MPRVPLMDDQPPDDWRDMLDDELRRKRWKRRLASGWNKRDKFIDVAENLILLPEVAAHLREHGIIPKPGGDGGSPLPF